MAKALSKAELAAALAKKSGFTKKTGVEVLENLATLAHRHAKDTFTLPGIGKLLLQPRKARMGRNPKTREPVMIPARKVPAFTAGKGLRDAVAGSKKRAAAKKR